MVVGEKAEITAAVESINKETVAAEMENFSQYLQMVLNAQQSHIKYVFTLIKFPVFRKCCGIEPGLKVQYINIDITITSFLMTLYNLLVQ
jgi:hypothetical protein